MWFKDSLLVTDALRKMVNHNRNKVEVEMLHILSDIMSLGKMDEYKFCIVDMVHMIERRGHKVSHSYIRRIVQQNWGLKPSEPTYYTSNILQSDGTLKQSKCTGRYYTITKEMIDKILLDC